MSRNIDTILPNNYICQELLTRFAASHLTAIELVMRRDCVIVCVLQTGEQAVAGFAKKLILNGISIRRASSCGFKRGQGPLFTIFHDLRRKSSKDEMRLRRETQPKENVAREKETLLITVEMLSAEMRLARFRGH